MNRRELVKLTAAGAAVALSATSQAAHNRLEPAGFANPKIAIGRGVYAEPKRSTGEPHLSKVPGTMVSLAYDPPDPKTPSSFYVTIFAQYRRNEQPWIDAQCYPPYSGSYSFGGIIRDIYRPLREGQRITLFVPDGTFNLKPNTKVDIRFEIRFYDLDNTLLPELSHALPHETVTPPPRDRRIVLDFGRGNEDPPMEIYDVLTRTTFKIE